MGCDYYIEVCVMIYYDDDAAAAPQATEYVTRSHGYFNLDIDNPDYEKYVKDRLRPNPPIVLYTVGEGFTSQHVKERYVHLIKPGVIKLVKEESRWERT